MVVVVLVSILAVLAIPNLQTAREDRLAFRTADGFARVIHAANTRAQGRGAAQLVLITTNGTLDRGIVTSFESLDPQGRPVSGCKNNAEWAGVPAGSVQNPIIEAADTNQGANSLQVTAGLESNLAVTFPPAATGSDKAAAVCFTPGGRVYVTLAATAAAAITAMETALPFTGDLVLEVVRKPLGVAPVGLRRRVIMSSSGGTRIHSI